MSVVDGGGETPGPIPNPEAKPARADGTAPGREWESRLPPTQQLHTSTRYTTPPLCSGCFSYAWPETTQQGAYCGKVEYRTSSTPTYTDELDLHYSTNNAPTTTRSRPTLRIADNRPITHHWWTPTNYVAGSLVEVDTHVFPPG